MTAQAFATRTHLAQLGLPSATLDRADAKVAGTVDAQLEAANATAEAALQECCTLPLASWGMDLALQVAALAAWPILCVVGFNPEALERRWEAATQYFRDVAARRFRPAGIVDSTPDVEEGGFAVSTRASRRWVR